MNETSEYIEAGEKCLKLAQKEDIDHAEIFIGATQAISIDIERGSVKSAKRYQDHGISMRAVKKGSIGFAISTNFEWKHLEQMVLSAIKLSKTGVPDPEFHDIAKPATYSQIPGLYDRKLANMEIEKAIDYCIRAADAAQIDDRIVAVSANLICGTFKRFILNSNGIKADSEDTAIRIYCSTAAKENSENSSGFEFQSSRFLKIDPENVGKSSAELALKSLHTQDIETGTYTVILHPFAVANLFSSAIGSATNAESVQYKRSYLTDLLHEQIAVESLEIIDNGLYVSEDGIAGMGTGTFDGEGIPQQRTTLISKGILETYLHDTYTAGKAGCESTGNAVRPSYQSIPTISTTNLEIVGISGNLNSLISEIDKGILVYYTSDRPNLATGDFSGSISNGFKIEKGNISYPLKKAMLGINMLDFFKQIYAIGTDYRHIFGIIAPSIGVSNIKIAGAE